MSSYHTFRRTIATQKFMAEIVERVVNAPAERYDVFMQRFGVPTTAEGAEVICEILLSREGEDEEREC